MGHHRQRSVPILRQSVHNGTCLTVRTPRGVSAAHRAQTTGSCLRAGAETYHRRRAPPHLHSSPKRHFVDPALAVPALGASPQRLLADLEALGFLFESLAASAG